MADALHFHHNNFLGIPPEFSSPKSPFVILPVGYDSTTSYKAGTREGPAAILAASRQVETYDDELGFEPYEAGIYTHPSLEITTKGPKEMVERVYRAVLPLARKKKKVAMLGGEHSLTFGTVRAYKQIYKNLSVLQIDAHADLRDSFEDSPYNHACVMRRITELCPTVGVGIRNYSIDEAKFIKAKKIPVVSAYSFISGETSIDEILDRLTDTVYLTFDLDGFDPSFMPAVGTPEPGGVGWYETLKLLRFLAERKRVVGFDVMELCPLPGQISSDFIAAKLVYKIIGYLVAAGKRPA
ncbi:MAG TPA: agmatinase [Verrucomicrobiae bacterium]|nr:agmatinase [Verrucomicrobiae bacterium]